MTRLPDRQAFFSHHAQTTVRKNRREHFRRQSRALIIMAGSLFAIFAAAQYSLAGEDCQTLLKNRCEKCHYLTRICQKVEKEQNKSSWFGSGGSWKRTVRNMVRQGAILTEEEEKTVVECLSKPTPDVLDLCGLKK